MSPPKQPVSFRLDPTTVALIDEAATRAGVNRTQWVEKVIDEQASHLRSHAQIQPDLIEFLSDLSQEHGGGHALLTATLGSLDGNAPRAALAINGQPLPEDHRLRAYSVPVARRPMPLRLVFARAEYQTAWQLLVGIVPAITGAAVTVPVTVLSHTAYLNHPTIEIS